MNTSRILIATFTFVFSLSLTLVGNHKKDAITWLRHMNDFFKAHKLPPIPQDRFLKEFARENKLKTLKNCLSIQFNTDNRLMTPNESSIKMLHQMLSKTLSIKKTRSLTSHLSHLIIGATIVGWFTPLILIAARVIFDSLLCYSGVSSNVNRQCIQMRQKIFGVEGLLFIAFMLNSIATWLHGAKKVTIEYQALRLLWKKKDE